LQTILKFSEELAAPNIQPLTNIRIIEIFRIPVEEATLIWGVLVQVREN
jgi:hypothetical protein